MKTSIKLKFRPSAKPDKEGTFYYQLIHERRVQNKRVANEIQRSGHSFDRKHYVFDSPIWLQLGENNVFMHQGYCIRLRSIFSLQEWSKQEICYYCIPCNRSHLSVHDSWVESILGVKCPYFV